MTAAILATLLFATSVVLATRTARLLGAMRANLYRLIVATALLAGYGHTFGQGLGGGGFGWFFLSGCIGFGFGDLALFASLPRIGPRLAGLLIQCLAAPFAAVAEWLWLGTVPTVSETAAGAAILVGVGLAVAPKGAVGSGSRVLWIGVGLGVLAALGQGLGAVVSRKAYAVAELAGGSVDGMTAAYQRILGGLVMGAPASWWLMRGERAWGEAPGSAAAGGGARGRAWMWVVGNALAGPTIGVACYQWALQTTPTGVVLPIVATMPIVLMPLAFWLENDRPSMRSIAGSAVAVGGVVAMAMAR